MADAIENAVFGAWNHADYCRSVLDCCGARQGQGMQKVPDANELRRLRKSVDLLDMHVRDIERLAKVAR